MNKPIKRAFLDTEDGQIHYRMSGEGDPLLLLHMSPRSSDEFRELIPILAHKRRVIAMDFLGLGDSDKPARMYTIEEYAKTVLLLIDSLGINKASILGNHTGAYVAGEFAAAYPEHIEKLILSNLDDFGEEGKAKLFRLFDEGFKIKEDGSHLMERWLDRIGYVGSTELNHRLVLDDLKCFGYPVYPGLAVANYCLSFKRRFCLIKCPTLILSGIEDVKQVERLLGLENLENRRFILELIPHSKMVEIEGGTLSMINQRPEEISELVIQFLNDKNNLK